MTTIFIHHRINKDLKHWLNSPKRREALEPIGVTNIRTSVDPQDPAHVAFAADVADMEAVFDACFSETTTIGLRHHEVERERLAREIVTVDTPLGAIRFKVASRNGRIVNASPEFDDCVRIAAAHARTVKDIQALAVQCYGGRESDQGGLS